MMSGSWATEGDGQNFLSVWVILCPFTPLTICKIKILKKLKEKKKKKKPGDNNFANVHYK